MKRYTTEDRINTILEKTAHLNLTKKMIKEILFADAEYMSETLLEGGEVAIKDVGCFKFHYTSAKNARVCSLPTTSKMIPASKEYNRLFFRVSNPLQKAIREKTEGNVFNK